jgi:hypothetical protein
MLEPPDLRYGHSLDSNYQGQENALSKHFRREHHRRSGQADLFQE